MEEDGEVDGHYQALLGLSSDRSEFTADGAIRGKAINRYGHPCQLIAACMIELVLTKAEY